MPALAGLLLVLCASASAREVLPLRFTGAAEPQPERPFLIAIFGDSQGEGLAAGMRHLLESDKTYRVLNRTKPGTALSQPLDYDWPAAVSKFAAGETADVAIMMFGGNDTLPTRISDGKPIPYRSDEWVAAYEQHEKDMVSALTGAGIHVIWCGDPIASQARYSDDMAWLNDRFQEGLPKENAEYLSLWTVVADESGSYTAYGQAHDGVTRRLRGIDGIHFTAEGYEVVADKVFAAIETWRSSRVASASP
ncbi:MAG TPA: DUF459 domain-containing protein [Stellaceae bacterium]|nr:DUF459 domain-containing protein [Stellaceae bacterium]